MTDGPSPPHAASRPRLLLIDEDPADRALAVSVLTTLFPLAELTQVAGEAELLPALKRGAYDVVIAELDVDWAHWLYLLGAIRARQEGAEILLFTHRDDPEDVRAALKAGARRHVVKSSRGFLDLTRAVDDALESRDLDAGGPASAAEGEGEGEAEPLVIGAATQEGAVRSAARDRARGARRVSMAAGRAAAGWLERARNALREPDWGELRTPLALFLGVLTMTAVLTYLLVGAGGEPERRPADTEPQGEVAASVVGGGETSPSARQRSAERQPRASAPPRAPLALELQARGEVWVRLTLDGKVVLDTTLRRGEIRIFEAERLADLLIGNAAGLAVIWNGRDLGSLGRQGEVRRLHFSPTEFGRGPPPAAWRISPS